MAAPLLAPLFASLAGSLARIAPAAANSMNAQAAATAASARAAGAASTATQAGRVISPPVHPMYRPPMPPPAPGNVRGDNPFGPGRFQQQQQPGGQGQPQSPAPSTVQPSDRAPAGPFSNKIDDAIRKVGSQAWGRALDMAHILTPMVKGSELIGDGLTRVTKDVMDFGGAAIKATNLLVPAGEKLAKLGGDMLEANRHLAANNAAMGFAYARLDIGRERHTMTLASMTSGSTSTLVDAVLRIEKRLLPIQADVNNFKQIILTGVLTKLDEGIEALEPFARGIAKMYESTPLVGSVIKEVKEAIKAGRDLSDAEAATERAKLARMALVLGLGVPRDRDRPPIGKESLGKPPGDKKD